MAGFLIRQGAKKLVNVPDPALEGFRIFRRAIPKYLKPAADYTRGLFKGTPKRIPLGNSGATTETVTISLRAGIQTRYIVTESTKFVAFKAPSGAYKTAKIAARMHAKDYTAPYDLVFILYRTASITRNAAGRTTRLERGIDAAFAKGNKYLAKAGLEPSFRGLAGSGLRYLAYATAATGLAFAGEKIDAIYATSRKYLKEASDYSDSLRPVPVGGGVDSPAPTGASVGTPPVVVGDVGVRSTAPYPPPVTATQPRPRRYLPSGGG